MWDVFRDDALTALWNGDLRLQLPDSVPLNEAGDMFALLRDGVAIGLWGDASLEDQASLSDGWRLKVRNLPGVVWLLWSNLLCRLDGVAGQGCTLSLATGESTAFEIKARAYVAEMPRPHMPVNFPQVSEFMENFSIRFIFDQRLDADGREQFCQQLDQWAALVDAGAFFGEEEALDGSVIGGYSSRFEDFETALLSAEGLVASRYCLGLLLALSNRWHRVHALRSVELV